MKIDEIVTLIEAVSKNGLTSFEYQEGDQKLTLKKKNQVVMQAPAAAGKTEDAGKTEAADQKPVDIGSDRVVTSPLVGTFYAAPAADAEAFVHEGDTVKKGQVLGIIEAMKLMNEIESEYDGVVEAILVKNEDVVEYGQPLFRIR